MDLSGMRGVATQTRGHVGGRVADASLPKARW